MNTFASARTYRVICMFDVEVQISELRERQQQHTKK